MVDKKFLRQKYLKIRSSFSKEQVENLSRKIKNRFFNLNLLKTKNKFLLYHSFRNEIITYEIIDRLLAIKKEVYLPYISDNKEDLGISRIFSPVDLESGMYGIKEPVEKQNIPIDKMDVIVVPGLLFDKKGYRIGYGGGYYDRLLAKISSDIITIGLAYDSFLLDLLPVEKYDFPVKVVVTEKRTLFNGGAEN